MSWSLKEILRNLLGGPGKERSIFASEKEAYDFCRKAYRESGGVTPELRRGYEFYMTHYRDDCEKFVGPNEAKDHQAIQQGRN